ncbi:hypothetical protein [Halovibrio sp. HP20-50]|uniref:hypothetical protein n=1 Tax=Halovibrio sp. HP20-59 TaxID=3080275 RepID=UPI00294B9393|nr:hypothetical protein [Halovibrio sp. HP20-59]MEA2118999.1 hypothetical protein [Halovibrio sp. HP20-59]
MTDDSMVKRKNDHFYIVLDDIDLSTRLFHKTVNALLLISSMTGVAERVALQSGSDHGRTKQLRRIGSVRECRSACIACGGAAG